MLVLRKLYVRLRLACMVLLLVGLLVPASSASAQTPTPTKTPTATPTPGPGPGGCYTPTGVVNGHLHWMINWDDRAFTWSGASAIAPMDDGAFMEFFDPAAPVFLPFPVGSWQLTNNSGAEIYLRAHAFNSGLTVAPGQTGVFTTDATQTWIYVVVTGGTPTSSNISICPFVPAPEQTATAQAAINQTATAAAVQTATAEAGGSACLNFPLVIEGELGYSLELPADEYTITASWDFERTNEDVRASFAVVFEQLPQNGVAWASAIVTADHFADHSVTFSGSGAFKGFFYAAASDNREPFQGQPVYVKICGASAAAAGTPTPIVPTPTITPGCRMFAMRVSHEVGAALTLPGGSYKILISWPFERTIESASDYFYGVLMYQNSQESAFRTIVYAEEWSVHSVSWLFTVPQYGFSGYLAFRPNVYGLPIQNKPVYAQLCDNPATPTPTLTPTNTPTGTVPPTPTPTNTPTMPPTSTPVPTINPGCNAVPRPVECDMVDLLRTQIALTQPSGVPELVRPTFAPTATPPVAGVIDELCRKEPCHIVKESLSAVNEIITTIKDAPDQPDCHTSLGVVMTGVGSFTVPGASINQGFCYFIEWTAPIRWFTRILSVLFSALLMLLYAIRTMRRVGDV